jgi:hypothetical protein
MDLLRLAAGWLLVMLLGVGLVRRAYGGVAGRDPHPAWIGGTGFLAGAFALTLAMRAISAVGVAFGVLSIGGTLLAVTLLAWWPDLRRLRTTTWRSDARKRTAGWTAAQIAWWLLLAWLALRAALLLGEVLRQPLFPWDAWTQWATKARVWFEMRRMVPFVFPGDWLAATTLVYQDAAPHYPATVPLLQVWSSVVLGRWDDALMNVPWWALGVALAATLYGFLRDQACSPLYALVGTWMIVSMPILDTHMALAGYADLPLACYLTGGALAGYAALQRRSAADALLALPFVIALPMIKNPGWVWMVLLVPGVLVALMPRLGPRIVLAGWLAALAAMLAFARYDAVVLGYHLHLQLNVPWHGLLEAYFSFANWHLLFFALPAVLLVARRWLLAPDIVPFTAVAGSGALFLLLGFSLTNVAVWVEDQSTVNRATLHLAPLLGVWLLLLMHRALAAAPDRTAAAADGRPPASDGAASDARASMPDGAAPGRTPAMPTAAAAAEGVDA